jgi:hypothetical protein
MPATIDYIEDVIRILGEATVANLHTPAREGNVVSLTPDVADDVMITADLHGHRVHFNRIQKVAELARHPRRHLVLQEVCHGGPTYPASGGCMSHTMLEDVARLKVRYPHRVHFLMSNHEWAELADYPILKGKRMLNLMFRLGMTEAYGPAAEKVRAAYLAFIRSCPLAVRLPGDVLVCHSLPEGVDHHGFDADVLVRPLEADDLRERGDVFWLLWGRDYRPENARAFARLVGAKVLLNGHDPCPDGYSVPNDVQIILDCCGDKACYVILPTSGTFNQQEIVRRIQRL